MPLRELVIKGFKSFAKKTVLEFEPGIVAIVGPNGSGKSNLAEAVLWVLGEQSTRALRTSSMEEVIFDGSTTHPPVSLVEVSLTLDDYQNHRSLRSSESSEIIFTRRALRSGDSAYFINRHPCRLLDIQELLSDFSLSLELSPIISQGELEEILKQKPEERVALIEEAAGVLKHKKRKLRTLRKLLSSQEKLKGAQAILREVQRQLFPLKKQAAAAELKKKYFEALKKDEVALALSQLKKAQNEWERLGFQEKRLKSKIFESQKELKSLEEKIESLGSALNPLFKSKEKEGQTLKELSERAKGGFSLLKEKRSYLKHHLEQAFLELKNFETQKTTLNKRLLKLKTEKKAAEIELEKLYFKLKTAGKEAEALKKKRREVEEELSRHKIQTEPPSEPLALKSLQKKGLKVLGILKDLLEVSSEYRPAIEAFLDSDLFCLVLETKKELFRALKILKDVEGKARLISLEAMKPPLSSPLPPAIVVSDIIKNNSSLGDVFKMLFNRVYLVKDLKMVRTLQEKSPDSTFVTLEGEVISSSGKVRANYNVKTLEESSEESSVLRSSSQVQKLEKERKRFLRKESELAKELSKLNAALGALRERQLHLKKEEEEAESEMRKLEDKKLEKEAKISQFQKAKVQIESVESFYNILLDSLAKLKVTQENLAKKKESSLREKRKLWQENQNRAAALKEEIGRLNQELYEIKFSLSSLQAEVKEKIQKIVNEYGISLEKALKEYSTALSEAQAVSKINELKAKIEAIGEVNQLAVREAEALEEREEFLKGQIEDLIQSRKALEKIARAIDKKIEKRFLDTFEKINEKFKSLFAQVFPGGKAELFLTQPDSSWGLEIKAEPVGKRLKNISLLSGGEKALVVLTLLFAVYMVRPSPFYILDEVEPALDDVNLQRFLNLLEELKKEAQFLVVTHQRRTMEAADSLWGVTMENDGISKLISYKPSNVEPLEATPELTSAA